LSEFSAGTADRRILQFIARQRLIVATRWESDRRLPTVHSIAARHPQAKDLTMNADRRLSSTTARATQRLVALALALFATLATLGGIDTLATGETAGAQWVQAQTSADQG
jgi:hypothetical protein